MDGRVNRGHPGTFAAKMAEGMERSVADAHIFDSASHANDDKKQNEDLIAKNGGRFIETGWRYQGPP
jgi:hypothetical protein